MKTERLIALSESESALLSRLSILPVKIRVIGFNG